MFFKTFLFIFYSQIVEIYISFKAAHNSKLLLSTLHISKLELKVLGKQMTIIRVFKIG